MKITKLVLVAACLALAGCVIAPSAEQIAAADFGSRPTPEQSERACREWFQHNLKDYESARFEWGALHKASFKNGPMRFGYAQFVEVNAKNSYGGYVGFRPYVIFIENGAAITDIEPLMNAAPFMGVAPLVQIVTLLD